MTRTTCTRVLFVLHFIRHLCTTPQYHLSEALAHTHTPTTLALWPLSLIIGLCDRYEKTTRRKKFRNTSREKRNHNPCTQIESATVLNLRSAAHLRIEGGRTRERVKLKKQQIHHQNRLITKTNRAGTKWTPGEPNPAGEREMKKEERRDAVCQKAREVCPSPGTGEQKSKRLSLFLTVACLSITRLFIHLDL